MKVFITIILSFPIGDLRRSSATKQQTYITPKKQIAKSPSNINLSVLRKENEALIEELQYWRNKAGLNQQDSGNRFQAIVQDQRNEIESLRNRLIQQEIKSKAVMGNDFALQDYHERVALLENENKNLMLQIKGLQTRLDDYEILIAKIKQNEENIKLFHQQLHDENEHYKQLLYSKDVEQELQWKTQDTALKNQYTQIEVTYKGEIQKLNQILRSLEEENHHKAQILEKENSELRKNYEEAQQYGNNLLHQVDLWQKKHQTLEEQKKQEVSMLQQQKEQSIQNLNVSHSEEKENLQKRINNLEFQNQQYQQDKQNLQRIKQ